ncbi:MAG TPA: hypothetical protein VE077_01495 [Candidatus Methylomirabilis sp.]|nr:hypothetical protein [Candidatus Methylomirabilis sp.]
MQEEAYAPLYVKLPEKRRDVELHGAFSEVQPRGDFFVAEILGDTGENLVLASREPNRGGRGGERASLDQFFDAAGQTSDQVFLDADHNSEIGWHLVVRDAMDSKQADGLLPGQAAALIGADLEPA